MTRLPGQSLAGAGIFTAGQPVRVLQMQRRHCHRNGIHCVHNVHTDAYSLKQSSTCNGVLLYKNHTHAKGVSEYLIKVVFAVNAKNPKINFFLVFNYA